MFDSTDSAKNARKVVRYITNKTPEVTFELVTAIVGGSVERINPTLQRHTINTPKGAIGLNVTCRQMAETPVMYLVEITKGKGGLLQYAAAIQGFASKLGPSLSQ